METPFTLGGEQRVVTILANYLVSRNYDVTFLLTDRKKRVDYNLYQLNAEVKIQFINELNKPLFKVKKKIWKIINKFNYKTGLFKNNYAIVKRFYCLKEEKEQIKKYLNNYDYIIGVASEFYSKLSVIKEKSDTFQIFAWQHSCFEAYFKSKNRRFFNQDAFIKRLFKNIDAYIVQTEDDRKKIKREFGFDSTTINNPNTYNSTFKNKFKNKQFIAAGRFTFMKNFDLLIESFKIFNEEIKDWTLTILGDGPEHKKCIALVEKYGLKDKVFLPGKTQNIVEIYLDSSIYLMSSSWEGWGMVVTEAMQCGLPVISYSLPSVKEIFGNLECGILVNNLLPIEFAKAMKKLVKSQKYKKLSNNCIKQVSNFNIDIVGEKWVNLFNINKRR